MICSCCIHTHTHTHTPHTHTHTHTPHTHTVDDLLHAHACDLSTSIDVLPPHGRMQVGQGDSQLIVFPSGFTILNDVFEASWNTCKGAEHVAERVLAITGSRHVDVGVISHWCVCVCVWVGVCGCVLCVCVCVCVARCVTGAGTAVMAPGMAFSPTRIVSLSRGKACITQLARHFSVSAPDELTCTVRDMGPARAQALGPPRIRWLWRLLVFD
jgi:hypothetical protein